MGLRYRKVIRLLPLAHLNLSLRGVSLSLGKPGATLNLKAGRSPRATVGLPGTGLSYSESLKPGRRLFAKRAARWPLYLLVAVLLCALVAVRAMNW